MDSENPKIDSGVQGYLKISINILGPGQKLPYHDIEKEVEMEVDLNYDISSQALRSSLLKEWKYLVVNVYQCVHLPVLKKDSSLVCQISYGGKKIETEVVKFQGLITHFNCQLWLPICYPNPTTQIIKFSIWSKDRIQKKLIANVMESISNFKSSSKIRSDPKWYNLYGCPVIKTEQSLVGSVGKVVKGTLASAANKVLNSVDHRKRYNDFPAIAPAGKATFQPNPSI
jgi:hypothetical protein